ncbi:unnamed protein product [Fraxinus pennsylvanica]|uniref:DUF506 family protein n=1 Tax=Fraxinus pennsylvanica TaxID=56036 RepID=A0AAD1ZS51_9LAMI|nr:unnamed protein product [Fraxinus pennsylvanica]
MFDLTRMKRVTDPLDDKVKARIFGSSGSEHSAQADDDVVSPYLFFGFPIDDTAGDYSSVEKSNNDLDSDERDSSTYDPANGDLIERILNDRTDSFKNMLLAHVLKAVQVFSSVRSDKQIFRRNVMAFLRQYGHNAAICKTKWESSGGLTAGNYEFIDVILRDSTRYFIDLDFAAEFKIARPTNFYEHLLQFIPTVFVGKDEELKQILKIMSDGAKRSLICRELTLPPWRKHRFLQNKWFGPYRRTANLFPYTLPSNQSYCVKCRAVGFDAAINGGSLLFPSTARTR